MHFQFYYTVALTSLTSSALYVKWESALLIAPCLWLLSHCKDISYYVKYACICRRIWPWCPAYRWLVYVHDLVYVFKPFNTFTSTCFHLALVDFVSGIFKKYLVNQWAFAGAWYSCNTGENSKRNVYIYILQIIFWSIFYSDKALVYLSSFFW